jgi:prolipoprotein diacylglyceryltransferase
MNFPFIQLYGICIFIGIVTALWLIQKKEKIDILSDNVFQNIIIYLYCGGCIGARLWYVIIDDPEAHFFAFYDGGFSLLGATTGACIVLVILDTLRYCQKNLYMIIPMYALIINGFGRIGCYCAPCCTGYLFTIPVQLCSALFYFCCFLIVYYVSYRYKNFLYEYIVLYGFFIALERFLFDYFRYDCIPYYYGFLSQYQFNGLLFFVVCMLLYMYKRVFRYSFPS